MDPATHHLIEAIHSAPCKCVLAVTGGGTGAVAALLRVPGGSRTVLEAVAPYHEEALIEYLGHRPESFCSPAASKEMARRARARAHWLSPGGPVIGLGCTASLATDRPKKGDHRFHLTVAANEGERTYSLTLTKGARDREAEEAVLDLVLLNALAEAFAVGERLQPLLLPGEQIQLDSKPSADPLADLVGGKISALCVETDGRLSLDAPRPTLLLPGAFNPVHEGHWGLAAVAERRAGQRLAFELSVTNVDKPTLTVEEVRRRLHQFVWKAPVWLTRAPTFVEKAVLFPGAVFIVGADTAARIVAPRYYQDSPELLALALAQIRAQGCSFLVVGRTDASGRFRCLDELGLSTLFRDLFTGISESEFHIDISSTELRARPAL